MRLNLSSLEKLRRECERLRELALVRPGFSLSEHDLNYLDELMSATRLSEHEGPALAAFDEPMASPFFLNRTAEEISSADAWLRVSRFLDEYDGEG